MYKYFFGMEKTPFVRNMPPEMLYESEAFEETIARLSMVAEEQKFAMLIADPGCGKSTLIRRFCGELSKEDYIVFYLADSKLTPKWFYKGLLEQIGVDSKYYRGDLRNQLLYEISIIRNIHQKKVVCILDEAHLLNRETLEEFRFMLNDKFDSESPMAVILVGQPELWDNKLSRRSYTAIKQRIDMCCTLPHLDRAGTEQYVNRHMAYAGCYSDIFTEKALDEVHKTSTGIPRVINRICEKSLMYAYQNKKHLIDDHMIKYVIEHEMLGTMQ